MEKPDLNKPAFKINPEAAHKIYRGYCPMCSKAIGSFRDVISEREFKISGMCQECQDSVFGIGESE